MKRLKIKNTFHKIIDGFDVNESSREVKYSNVKIDFTGKRIADLPLKYQECQLVDGDFRHIDADDGQRIEGTNLQINQGSEKLSELEYVKGQTSQSGTPTPSSPQPINITTGRQVVSVCGKNLFNIDGTRTSEGLTNTTSGTIISVSGTSTNTYSSLTRQITQSIPIGTYTFSIQETYNKRMGFIPTFSDNTSTTYFITANTLSTTFTTTKEIISYRLYIETTSGTTYNMTIKPQLEKGNLTTYEEYKGTDYEINLGKNLFYGYSFSKTISGITFTYNEDGSITASGTATASATSSTAVEGRNHLIILQPNTTYALSGGYDSNVQIQLCDYSANVISTSSPNPSTFTTSTETRFYIRVWVRSGTTLNNVNVYPQLEKGSVATSYSPYKTPIYLGKIGTYQDYIFKNTTENPLYDSNLEEGQWYIHKEIGRVVLNGSENWSGGTIAGDYLYIYCNDYDNILSPNMAYTGISTHFKVLNQIINTYSPVITTDSMSLGSDTPTAGNRVRIKINKTTANTIANLKTWLSSHNVEVYYVLNTPTNTLIEDEELINQLNSIQLITGLNNINVSSPYLSGIIGLHYNFQVEQDIERVDEVIYTGYVNNYTLPKMKNKLEYRELDIDLLSPLALATLRTTDAVGTYNLRDLIREIIQPLIDDGFTLKELNVGNNQISVNYLTETIESSLNKLSNKFNFWWYIDKNKNIFINDISYIFNKNKVLTYDDNNKINGLIDFTPSMESIDYCNTIDFSNVRLFTYSYYRYYYYGTTSGESYSGYTSYNPMIEVKTINPGDEITFDIPFAINTSKSGRTDTSYELNDYYFKLEKRNDNVYSIAVQLLQDSNNKVIIPSNATISDSFNESKEFVFVRDNFFKNLIVGMKYNGSSTIQVSEISSTTALMLTKLRINDNEEIEKNKNIISTTGIVEKQIDANELWLTYDEVLEISKSYIGNNNVNVEKVNMLTDNENNLKVGDIITIDKPGFLTNGDFVITDKKRKYYDNVDQWEFVLNNTNILESYIDLFRATEEQEDAEQKYSLVTGNYVNEGVIENYEVDVQ